MGPWGDSTLYEAEVTWIAHANIPGIQSGRFSTEDVRQSGWALQTSGTHTFAQPFAKPPRVVAALSEFEYGCGRNITLDTSAKVSEKGIEWSMNSSGDSHQYITGCSYVAFDPVSYQGLVLFLIILYGKSKTNYDTDDTHVGLIDAASCHLVIYLHISICSQAQAH